MALFDSDFLKKLEYLSLISKRVFRGSLMAQRRTMQLGSGIEFADHREYTPGDDFRYLDWSAYQRFDRLLIRLYEEEEDLSIYFILDTSSSMGFGDGDKLKQAKRLCAALAYVGLANLDRIAIEIVERQRCAARSAEMPLGRGRAFETGRCAQRCFSNSSGRRASGPGFA